MDLKQIEKLMSAMERMQIKRISLKKEDFEIEIEKQSVHSEQPVYSVVPQTVGSAPQNTVSSAPQEKKESGLAVTSPMVGTFYSASSPEDPPYIKVGDSIEIGAVVCIIEAMKVMNEVKSEVSGTVQEVLIKNGEPVEFGTELFKIG